MNIILTPRERQIFNLLIQNYSTKDIARELGISEKTVRNHISNVIQKLGVDSRMQAIFELIKLKELQIQATPFFGRFSQYEKLFIFLMMYYNDFR